MNKYSYIFFAVSLSILSYIFYFYKTTNDIIRDNIFVVDSISQYNKKNKQLTFETKDISIADKKFSVFIADTDETREKGLGGFTGLARDEGMLFVFDTPAKQTFWMKDMLFDIDIIWIDENKKVIGIEKNVPKDSYKSYNQQASQTFTSPDIILYVLELSAGESDRRNIKIGDEFKL